MIIADYLNYGQRNIVKRIIVAVPLFVVFGLTQVDFTILWRYFLGKSNNSGCCTMGRCDVSIDCEKEFWVAAIPAVFMTWNIFTYILSQKIGLG